VGYFSDNPGTGLTGGVCIFGSSFHGEETGIREITAHKTPATTAVKWKTSDFYRIIKIVTERKYGGIFIPA
jgi:hypothetical protein